ncbi:MAG: 30S ribosomal protein S20 [Ezakiella sp.]|nr:30S ribosomal protein S20 [Ezakiella sp.]MDD7762091.1 30S ribosomal protein S20 [Bacillota bacterium]MDY3947058.1 30S ribosomal protein S20 [Ezakiella sp.]
MANIKSAKKKIRVIEKKSLINKNRKSEIKTLLKKFDLLVAESKFDEARELLKVIDKKLKRAEQRNILHKNNVARKMSRLTRKLNQAV